MKGYLQKLIFFSILSVLTSTALQAQYDDVYYDPDADTDTYYESSDRDNNYRGENTYDEYDDDYFDDYDYYYSSRIRRFNRPYRGFGFYDPCYVDSYYYNPFFGSAWSPGASIYIGFGNDYFSYRRYRRALRWNNYRFGWNPISAYYANNFFCPPGFSYFNSFNSPFGYYGGFGNFGNFYGGYSNAFYYNNFVFCPTPIYNGGNVNTTIVNINEGTNGSRGVIYGPRSTGTVKSSPRGVVAGGGLNAPSKDTRSEAAKGQDYVTDRPTNTVPRTNDNVASSPITNSPTKGATTQRPSPTTTSPSKADVTKGGVTRTDVPRTDATRTDVPRTDVTKSDRTSTRPVYRPSTRNTSRDNYTPPSSYRPSNTRGTSPSRTDQPSTYRPSSRSDRTYNPSATRPSTRSERPSSAPSYRPSSSQRSSSPSRSYMPSSSSRSSSGTSRSYSPSSSSRSSSGSSRSFTPSSRSSSGSSASPTRSAPSRSSGSASPSRSSSSPRSSGSSSSPRRGNN